MMRIGLTGGIASGKSTVARQLKRWGAWVIDADQVGRALVEPGSEALAAIVEAFGPQYLDHEGCLCRTALAETIFADAAARKTLNKIMHPRIRKRIEEEMQQILQQAQPPHVVLEAALLYEAGMEDLVDQVWVVRTEGQACLRRLIDRDELGLEQAMNRIQAQMPQDEKLGRADVIIDNSGTWEETLDQLRRVWREISDPAQEEK